ncbi:tumor rejection antigen P815A-like [Onychomys torridus]|uniref:tumor rejection antigen P815A-like n=1 Tax=Onychomys torridus TaxID=38674 RepID=UPI00167FCDAC|nr:tumor rejection antigen P815A-like [Onychomys torridus]
MAYISYQDWAVGGLCTRAGSDEDLREQFIIVVLFSLEWLVFVGVIGFLIFQIILQTIWKKEEQEADDIAMLQKPPPINEEQQQEVEVYEYELNEYADDDIFESKFSENFYEDLDFMNEEDSKEEEDDDTDDGDDSGTSSICLTVNRFMNEEVKYKIYYYFRDLDILESQSVVTDEPAACECDTSDKAFEGIANEEHWGKEENGDLDYQDRNSPECCFPE